ncbi:hypothetical protein QBC40DRAFT_278458 [Triangularia verruculosa]|uniref:Secreted protein n=1 Tax=Triangularia verruculosa TaxID=2587418 RepID=A0AAN6XKH8_9PEZI|nr:hypothetical protein QBC40DRAFT_278458 [Triangularia verruculosa]
MLKTRSLSAMLAFSFLATRSTFLPTSQALHHCPAKYYDIPQMPENWFFQNTILSHYNSGRFLLLFLRFQTGR